MHETLTLDNYDDILEVKDLQKVLHISKSVAYNLLKNREIKSIRIGRVYKIPKKYLLEYLSGK